MARIQEFTPMHNKAANRHQALTISTISSKNYSRSKRNALDKTNFVLEMSHNQKNCSATIHGNQVGRKAESVEETSNSDGIFSLPETRLSL